MKKTITIFGSSLPRSGDIEYEDAYMLGKLLAEKGFNVCSGGYQGIMDAVWELMNKNLLNRKPAACHSQMWKKIVGIMEKQIMHEGRMNGLISCFKSVKEIAEYLEKW